MNKSNISFALVFLLSAVLALGFGSAALQFVGVPSQINITHGTSQTFSFTLNNTDTVNSYNVSLSAPNWIIFSPNTLTNLQNLTSSSPITATVTVPAHTVGNIYAISLSASNGVTSYPQNINLNVPVQSLFTINPSSQSIGPNGNGTFTITNNGNDISSISLTSSDSIVTLSQSSVSVAPGNTSAPISFSTVASSLTNGATHSTLITATQGGVSLNSTITTSNSFCNPLIGSNLSITSNDITITNDGRGDDTGWILLDTIRIKADVFNNGLTDLSDVYAVLGIFDSSGRNVASKMIYTSSDQDKIRIGRIDSGNDKTVTFEFKVPGDLKTGSYNVIVKTYKGSVLCSDSSSSPQAITIETEGDSGKSIGFDDIKLSVDQATCGDTVNLDLSVINIGDNNEDQVKVRLYNKELNIDQTAEVKQGLNQGDSQSLSFSFPIPAGLSEKYYQIELTSQYDYSNGVYRQSSDSSELVPLKVFGCGTAGSSSFVAITASLQSTAKAGEDLIVAATIKNTGSTSSQFTVDLTGYSEWASLNSISDRLITLNAGESKTVQISLLPNTDVTGDKSLNLEVRSGSNLQTKQVVVNFAGSASSFWNSLKGNSLAWIIGLVNVILIVLIIVVAVKLSKN